MELVLPGATHPLLQDIHLRLPGGHLGAVVGPSGCGKSTLLKVIAGIQPHTAGRIRWQGRDLEEQDLPPHELGYVPQFTCAQGGLTVRENLLYTARLRQAGPFAELEARVQQIEEETDLTALVDRRAGVLSGGQLRKLGLAMELITRPSLLLADEVTSGLDPQSEEEITQLLRSLACQPGRLVLVVTHSLRFLEVFDSVTVLNRGRLVYSDSPGAFCGYFGVSRPEDVFPALSQRTAEAWAGDWVSSPEELLAEVSAEVAEVQQELASGGEEAPSPTRALLPGFVCQTATWLSRRVRLFLRDPTQLLLQISLAALFPAVVTLFAYQGLPSVRNLAMEFDASWVEQMKETLTFTVESGKVGTLVSGLAMFQVILLCLMGSNNSAREVVGNRLILEKEKLAGLRPGAVLAGMALFCFFLVLAQSAWMALFVKAVCQLPGALALQFFPFFLVTAAMTSLCLAISSWTSSTEQASLGSLYLVGFQLPLSGAILPLPEVLGQILRPLISAYWAWSGYLQTLRDTRFYDLVRAITETPISPAGLSLWILSLHLAGGLFFAYWGIRRPAWR